MYHHYKKLEARFERFSEFTINIFGNSITFLIALVMVIIWITQIDFSQSHDAIRDILLAITFLSFFIIQKTVNKYSKALHLKLNELVTAHENASDDLANIEDKTEHELNELSKASKSARKN